MDQEIDSVFTQINDSQDYFQKAKLILFLKRDKGVRVNEISKKIRLKPSYISHILRLNHLPELVKDGYYSKFISISHLFIVSRLKTDKQMIEVYEKILSENLSTQQTESMVREILYQLKDRGEYLSHEERSEFSKNYNGTDAIRTQIIQSRLRGKLIIEIKGNLEKTSEELRKIMDLLRKRS